LKAVIMAGGLGMRLRPLTSIIPKPLLPLGDRSILEILLKNLEECGVKDVFIATNYMSEYFETYFRQCPPKNLRLHFSRETIPLGTAGPLKLLEDELTEPFLVVNGDILTNLDFQDFYSFFQENSYEVLLATTLVQLPTNYGVVTRKGSQIVEIEEKPNIEAEVVAGIYCLDPSVLKKIPAGKNFDMPELLHRVSEEGKLGAFPLQSYWLDIGHMEHYEKAKEDIRSLDLIESQTANPVDLKGIEELAK
jgi:NDP-mannose synthase